MQPELHFHHIAIATRNLQNTEQFYISIGYSASDVIHDAQQKVNIAFLTKDGEPMLEILEPSEEGSPIQDILRKNGTTPYHICYETANLDAAIAFFREKKFLLLRQPVPARALEERRICFMYKSDTGLIELLEKTGR